MSTLSLTELREEIAQLCDDIASGRETIQSVFAVSADVDAPLSKTYVYVVKIVERVPGIGKVKARKILDALSISERCHLGDLTPEQRTQILAQVIAS
jgi:hypothetical protein